MGTHDCMRTLAVIPARFHSKRLPGKALKDLHGKTMVERVYERASEASQVDRVLVATDDERIRDVVAAFGGEVVMTSSEHQSGSDRIAEAVQELPVELIVNVQGDEPLIDPAAIDAAVEVARETPSAIVTLQNEIAERKTWLDPNVVKVVTDSRGFALYFSRSPIPSNWPNWDGPEGKRVEKRCFKHIGLYVYPKDVLMKLTRLPPSPLERAERLEQLRALENGIPIRLKTTSYDSMAVDTEADLEHVRYFLSEKDNANSTV